MGLALLWSWQELGRRPFGARVSVTGYVGRSLVGSSSVIQVPLSDASHLKSDPPRPPNGVRHLAVRSVDWFYCGR